MSSDATSSGISLQTALHTATRATHANLNKNIMARMPLSLPPYSSDPTAYYLGILMFGHIFLTFEQAISDVLSQTPSSNELNARNMQLLQILSTDRLQRSNALNQDLEILSETLQAQNPLISLIEARVRNQAIENTSHIFKNIKSRPHLALAYTWTMYLAMFNGGRWLYKQLEAPGPQFWLEPTPTAEDNGSIQALSFWRLDSTLQDPNAEELKLEFKRNFEQASEMLNSEEKDEVVKEAVSLFDLCLSMIADLDTIMAQLKHDTKQFPTDEVRGTKTPSSMDTTSSLWSTVSSALFAPAHRMLNSTWTRPMKGEVKAVD